MRIGIDITFLSDQRASSGIETYSKEITKNLISNQTHTWVLFGLGTDRENYSKLNIKKLNNVEFVSLGKPRQVSVFNRIYFKLFYLHKIRKSKLDLYFAPNFEKGLPNNYVDTVTTVHNIIPFVTNQYSTKSKLSNYLRSISYKKNLNDAKDATLVFTDSDFSKRELVHKGGFREDKVVTSHLAVSDTFKKANISQNTREIRRVLVMYKISKPYVLYYGNLESNKNISNLLTSFSKVANRHPDLKLVLSCEEFKVGWDNKPHPQSISAQKILDLITDLKLKHKVIITGATEDRHLPIIMNNAEMFIHLSTYEGFGTAVLEAITGGTPVIAAKRSCYSEILQDGAMLINPYDIDKITNAILETLQKGPAITKQINRGLKISTQYSWDTTANNLLDQFNRFQKTPHKLKIAYLLPHLSDSRDRLENNAYNIAQKMVEIGHDVTIMAPNTIDSKHIKSENIDGLKINRYPKINKQYRLGIYPKMLIPLIFQKFDIIHTHGIGFVWQDFIVVLKKIFSPRTRFINTPHNLSFITTKYKFIKNLLKNIYSIKQKLCINNLYHKIIQINPFQTNLLYSYKIKPSKITYISNGIDTVFFEDTLSTKITDKIKLGRKFIIAVESDFEEHQGIQYIIKALPDILEYKKNVQLVLMGENGSYLKCIKDLIEELNLSKKVSILIAPDKSSKAYILQKSEIFISSKRKDPFGVSILEAMSKNNAIITTRTEGGEFLVKEEENGFLFDYADTKALSELIIECLKDKDMLKNIQKNNVLKSQKFTWDKIESTYSTLLREITRK